MEILGNFEFQKSKVDKCNKLISSCTSSTHVSTIYIALRDALAVWMIGIVPGIFVKMNVFRWSTFNPALGGLKSKARYSANNSASANIIPFPKLHPPRGTVIRRSWFICSCAIFRFNSSQRIPSSAQLSTFYFILFTVIARQCHLINQYLLFRSPF